MIRSPSAPGAVISDSCARSTGSSTQNRDPSPSVLSTWIVPPINSTNCRVMVRPRPVPFCAAGLPICTNASKMRA